MKIPTSTSFVMAATASLALQSSALTVPHPDSPDLAGVAPRSARTGTGAQFSGRGPTVRSSLESSPARRGIEMREAQADSSSSIDALLNEVSDEVAGSLDALGIKREEDKKNGSFKENNNPSLARRQMPVAPPGIPDSASQVASIPGQVVNGVVQPVSSIPNGPANNIEGSVEQNDPPNAPISFPLPPSGLPVPNSALQPPAPLAPLPQPISNIVPRDADDAGAFAPDGIAQQVPGIVQTVGGVAGTAPIGEVANIPLQTINGTPVGGAVGTAGGIVSSLPNPVGTVGGIVNGVPVVGGTANGVVQGASGAAGQVVGSTPVGQIAGNPYGALQGQSDPDDDNDTQYDENGFASPSSTVAAPSSSPSSSPDFATSTDEAASSSSDAASTPDTPMDMMVKQVSAPVPFSIPAPTNIPFSIVSGVLGNLPTPSLPIPLPVPTQSLPIFSPGAEANGAPAHKDPALAASPPVNPPVNPLSNPLVSPPVSPPVPIPSGFSNSLPIGTPGAAVSALPIAPPSFVPMKRDAGVRARAPPSEVKSVVDKLIADGTPPLFIPTVSAAKVASGPDASASVNIQFSSTVSSTQAGPSTSAITQSAGTTSTGVIPTMSTQPSRRRFFRFRRGKA
ncbi:hypothetical protein A7U60_g5844 [Sanghuangporus baumii]|uniref:Uncharacterized protein n=1 Tax=Sanghuangporus baumii TaxID=108892 RepID=A0A9Q5NB57_SANBA|nr:hypothetical protein A7U60_g5844 [Sanghuangporus baumii]